VELSRGKFVSLITALTVALGALVVVRH
jgi:hypothetical protein